MFGIKTTRKQKTALVALFMLLAPYVLVYAAPALAQTKEPDAEQTKAMNTGADDKLSDGAGQTKGTAERQNEPETNLVQAMAEQDNATVVTNVTDLLYGADTGQRNETYEAIKYWWSNDIISNLFANIGQLLGRWISEWINGWVASTVGFLSTFLRTFVLNPNIAVNGSQAAVGGTGQNDGISPYIRQGADVMYGIAVDLLLLLFILTIWKFWAEGAHRGGASLMSAVGRLIFTAGLMIAWPTLYAFEIQITNEMIQAIYFNAADQIVNLDAALTAVVKGGLLAGSALLMYAFAPIVGKVAGGVIGTGTGGVVFGTVGQVISFAGLVIYLILGIVLITQLIYILILKSIQTALLTAQYMFAPIFLVFFVTPDTENVTSGFVKSFVEVSLWTFVWVGLLKVMVIVIFSPFNPWGKLVMTIGVLQIMIQVPSFLSRAQISPMSDFIAAGMITGGLLKGAQALGSAAKDRTAQGFDYLMDQSYGSKGMRKSEKASLNGLPKTEANPELRKGIADASRGKTPGSEQPPGAGLKTGEMPKAGDQKKLKMGDKKDATGLTPPTKNPELTTPGGNKAGDLANAANKGVKTGAATAGLIGLGAAAMAANGARAGEGTKDDAANKRAEEGAMQRAAEHQAKKLDGMGDENDKLKAEQNKLKANATDDAKKRGAGANPMAGKNLDLSGVAKKGTGAGTGAATDPTVEIGKSLKGIAAGKAGADGTASATLGGADGEGKHGEGKPKLPGGAAAVDDKDGPNSATLHVNPFAGAAALKRGLTGAGADKLGKLDPKGPNAGGEAGKLGKDGSTSNVNGGDKGLNALGTEKSTLNVQHGAKGVQSLEQNEMHTLDHLNAPIIVAGAGSGLKMNMPGTANVAAGQKPAPASTNVAPIPSGGATGAMANNLSSAGVLQGATLDPTASRGVQSALKTDMSRLAHVNTPNADDVPVGVDPYVAFDQSGYRWVPGRGFAIDIRTAQGPTMGKNPNSNETVAYGGAKGTQELRLGHDATDAQKAMAVMSGGFANLFASNPVAYDAARQAAIDAGEDQPHGIVERAAAGFMAHEGKSFKQTKRAQERFQNSMYRHAMQGSEAYVGMQGSGNAYTQYLTDRYGAMSDDTQAWGVHIFTDSASPESGWSPRVIPATETLFQAGIPITAGYRAAAANPSVQRQPNWARGQAIRGVKAYSEAQAAQMAPNETNPYIKDGLAQFLGPNVPAAEVAACIAVMQDAPNMEAGESMIRNNPTLIRSIATMAQSGHYRDPSAAYRSLRISTGLASGSNSQSTVNVPGGGSPSGGGGGGGGLGGANIQFTGGGSAGAGSEIVDVNMGAMTSSGPSAAALNAINQNHGLRVERNTQIRYNPVSGQSNTHHTVQMNARGEVVSSHVSVTGQSGGTQSQTEVIDAVQNGNGSSAGDPLGIVQKEMGARADVINRAQNFDIQMKQAGFSDQQMQSNSLKSAAYQIYSNPNGGSSKMQSCAQVARILDGSDGLNMRTVQVYEAMVDAGWNSNKISRPDLHTADIIMQQGGTYPTPRYVEQMRNYPQFSPSPNPNAPLSAGIRQHVIDPFRSGHGDGVVRGDNGALGYLPREPRAPRD